MAFPHERRHVPHFPLPRQPRARFAGPDRRLGRSRHRHHGTQAGRGRETGDGTPPARMPRNSKASASWPAGSPTTSTTSWPGSWAMPICHWLRLPASEPVRERHRSDQESRPTGCGPDAADAGLFGQGQVHRRAGGPVAGRGRQQEDAGHVRLEEGHGNLQPGCQACRSFRPTPPKCARWL